MNPNGTWVRLARTCPTCKQRTKPVLQTYRQEESDYEVLSGSDGCDLQPVGHTTLQPIDGVEQPPIFEVQEYQQMQAEEFEMPDLEPAEALDIMTPPKTPEKGSDDESFGEDGAEPSNPGPFTVFGAAGATGEGESSIDMENSSSIDMENPFGGKPCGSNDLGDSSLDECPFSIVNLQLPASSDGPAPPPKTMKERAMQEADDLIEALEFYKGRLHYRDEEFVAELRAEVMAKLDFLVAEDPREVEMEMAPRAKKLKLGNFDGKNDLMAHLNVQFRMHLGVAVSSRDPDVQAACNFPTQQADAAVTDAMGLFSESIAACTDPDIEKIIALAAQTNNNLKFEAVSRCTLKQVHDLLQVRELQAAALKNATNHLAQMIVTGAFANDGGVVSWSGTDSVTMQSVCSHILKEKCKHAGATAAHVAGRG